MKAFGMLRIGTGVLGGGILLVNAVYLTFTGLGLPEYFYPLSALPGSAAGALLVAGAARGWIRGRAFFGACMILAGAIFLSAGVIDAGFHDSYMRPVSHMYKAVTVGATGPVLSAVLLAAGAAAYRRDWLAGLCMLFPGAMLLAPGLLRMIIQAAAGPLSPLLYAGHMDLGMAAGAGLLALGAGAVWQARAGARQVCYAPA
ncbi:membrane hypothetical protein [Nitrosopumilaceae archaeon]|nr:hypothetical protein [Nitrosopumilus sp.]CAI9830622.1 membrane hypothetical protein [Nitrosopumilaceae archaeon]